MCQTEQIKDKIQYNMDEKGFYIWNLLWFHLKKMVRRLKPGLPRC